MGIRKYAESRMIYSRRRQLFEPIVLSRTLLDIEKVGKTWFSHFGLSDKNQYIDFTCLFSTGYLTYCQTCYVWQQSDDGLMARRGLFLISSMHLTPFQHLHRIQGVLV